MFNDLKQSHLKLTFPIRNDQMPQILFNISFIYHNFVIHELAVAFSYFFYNSHKLFDFNILSGPLG